MGPGSVAPDFTLDRPDGSGQVQLSAYRGTPVWLNFWATWCPHCVVEMNTMQKVYNKYHSQGLEIIGVDDAEPAPPVLQFVQAHGYSWPMGLDLRGRVTGQYRVGGLPTHIFVDRKGIIQYRVSGELSPADMEKAANALLAP
jgi:peroxiredoxin